MSEMVPEQGGAPGGGMPRPFGIPIMVWVAGAAVIVYFLFFRGSSSAANPQTTGGGGTITTGDTSVGTGAVQVSVTQKGPTSTNTENEDQDQPQPPGPGPKKHKKKMVKVPNVKGQRAAYAISDIESVGLEAITDPFRNPKAEYEATGTTPAAGASVPEGTTVHIHVKEIAGPKPQTTTQKIPGRRMGGSGAGPG